MGQFHLHKEKGRELNPDLSYHTYLIILRCCNVLQLHPSLQRSRML